MPIYMCYHHYYIQLVKMVKTIGEHYLHTKFESVFSFQFHFSFFFLQFLFAFCGNLEICLPTADGSYY